LYDLVFSGAAAPSVGDLRALTSTKIFVPTLHLALTTALQRHSLALDLYLTPRHVFCEYYRKWITTVWIRIQMQVEIYVDEVYAGDSATAYSRFARWISLRLNSYLVRLTDSGVGVSLPSVHQFEELVQNRENPFAALPSKYLVSEGGTPSPTPSGPPTPAPVPPVDELPPANPRQSVAVANPNPVAELLTAYQAIGWRSRQCYTAKQPPRGSHGQMCLAYHGVGTCFEGCGRKSSHRPLSVPDKDKLLAYYAEVKVLALQA
jgi:hypothetical protein